VVANDRRECLRNNLARRLAGTARGASRRDLDGSSLRMPRPSLVRQGESLPFRCCQASGLQAVRGAMVAAGDVPHVRLGRSLRFKADQLADYLDRVQRFQEALFRIFGPPEEPLKAKAARQRASRQQKSRPGYV
jgi:hypothetical protein